MAINHGRHTSVLNGLKIVKGQKNNVEIDIFIINIYRKFKIFHKIKKLTNLWT